MQRDTIPYVVETYGEVTSTFDVLRQRRDEPEGLVIVAEAQTAGIGQRGRTFFSPPGTGIYVGILLKPTATDANVVLDETMVTRMTARAVCRAIEVIVPGAEPTIKLPNDVLVDGRKVCGILAQGLPATPEHDACLIVGIGVNVYEPCGGFPPEIADKAGALFSRAAPIPASTASDITLDDTQSDVRMRLVNTILDEFAS
ncbi:MAG: biotin--[acetyl-CoA-carboxylase] ligase [Coriobacteriia bacterium]|nr:biotin--[acetyl-CoA-carboxylase] ligase [Coriobacteriia bacterium]